MFNFYQRHMAVSLLVITSSLLGYFIYTEPKNKQVNTYKPTVYQQKQVAGPIQPLPEIVSNSQPWVMLGKALFHSPLLSRDNSISCATCHVVDNGGDDGFSLSTGINNQLGLRNASTVLNSSLNFRQFWDGRSSDLSAQAEGPIHNPLEMGSNFDEIIKKLSASPLFKKTFSELSKEGITKSAIIKALVTYQESLLTLKSPIDAYVLGDKSALTAQQIRGYEKFQQFGCITCHQGRNIGGNIYQKIGRISEVPKQLLVDQGRFEVTNKASDLHVFKVPSLRNVALTGPYFHNGSVDNLEEAVRLMAKMQLGLELADDDVADLVALLHAFTGKVEH